MIKDDDFWSTDRLLPPHRRREGSGGVALSQLNPYTPQEKIVQNVKFPGSRALHGATLYSLPGIGSSFAGFLKQAKESQGKKAAPGVPYRRFFSYTPSYRDLDGAQWQSYLAFREDVQNRRFRPVDYSYLALYCFELLNLGDQTEPQGSLDTLLWLWESYREEFGTLDAQMSDWVLDLCMEHKLALPMTSLDRLLPKASRFHSPVLVGAYLFDYLLSGKLRPNGEQTEYLLRALCDYPYRKLTLYRENALYASAMDGFVCYLFAQGFLTLDGQRQEFCNLKIPTPLTVKRSLYPGAVMDPCRRHTICLHYSPLLGDVNVKNRFTSLIKYVDNRVRKHLGMKQKFALLNNSVVHQGFIDRCFGEYFSALSAHKEGKLSAVPAAPVRKLQVNVEQASAIERASWKTTDILTKDLYEDGGETVVPGEFAPQKEKNKTEYVYEGNTEEDVTELAAALDSMERDFCVQILYGGADNAKAYAKARGQFFENLLGRINRKALELLGDVLLEPNGQLVEDYREQMEFLFPREEYFSAGE